MTSTTYSTNITNVQQEMLRNMVLLLGMQWVLVLLVIVLLHRFLPQRVCLFTCKGWLDTLISLVLALILFMLIFHRTSMSVRASVFRFFCFVLLGVLLSWIMAVEYNASYLRDPKQTPKAMWGSWIMTALLLVAAYVMLPRLLPYAEFFRGLSNVLFFVLLGLIVWALFGKFRNKSSYLVFFSIGLLLFVLFLFSDMVVITTQCRQRGSIQCDSMIGATTVYVDMMNILQNLFHLSSMSS